MTSMRKIGSISAFPEQGGVLRLDDGKGSSFYLLEGNDAAVLVDTGMAMESLKPVIEQLTNKPVTVLITHGHLDHMCHADEFDRVYMDWRDISMIPSAAKRLGINHHADTSRYQRFTDGDMICVGDLCIRVLGLGGHSAGSAVFYEPSRNLLFTGDAVGSGYGVWMQLEGSLKISQYQKNLQKFIAFLASLPEQPSVFPGHAEQRYMKPGTDNPVCIELVKDMETLCTMILAHKETRMEAPAAFVRERSPVYVAEYGRASIVYSEETIG